MTAYFGLLDVAQTKPGDTVLISGAAGAVAILVLVIGFGWLAEEVMEKDTARFDLAVITALLVLAGVIALVVVLCCIGGFVIANRDDDESSSSTTTSRYG